MKKTVKIAFAILSLSAVTSIAQAATPDMFTGLDVSKMNAKDHVTTNLALTNINGNNKSGILPIPNMLTMNFAYNFD